MAALIVGSAFVAVAPTAQAVTYVNTYLLIRWDGEGCVGTGTGTSISVVARDTWQALGTRTASWPGTTSATRCKNDSYGGLIQVGPVSLIRYDGYHVYRLEASITDASGTVTSFSADQAMRVGSSCVGSTYYMGTNGVYCSSTQPASNYLGRANALPFTPTIASLYPDYPDPLHSLYLYWNGPSTQPFDFREWEVHMSTTPGFSPSYSFPSTLKATRTYASNYLSVTGLSPDTTYCFKIRHADRYWSYGNILYRNYPSVADSAERCAKTATDALKLTSPNGGEVWSGTHPITWTGGSPTFALAVSADGGATYSSLASSISARSYAWNTQTWPDGANYRVRVNDATANDASDATFTIDNTPPVTTVAVDGPTCNGWYSAPPLVTLTATDNLAGVRSTRYNVGDGDRPYVPPLYVAREGNVTFRYWSDDLADLPNVETARDIALRIDTLPPQTRLIVGAPNATSDRLYVNASTELSLLATDEGAGVSEVEYRIDGGNWTRYTDPFRLTGPDGEHRIEYRARDGACHEETIREQVVFLDNTPPTIEIVEPGPPEAPAGSPIDPTKVCEVARILAGGLRDNGLAEEARTLEALLCVDTFAVVTGETIVRANATDPIVNGGASGMGRVEFHLDGDLRAIDTADPWEWTWNASVDEPGLHIIDAVAYDRLGQTSNDSLRVLVVGGTLDACGALVAGLPPEIAFVGAALLYALEQAGVGCEAALPPGL